MPGTARRRTWKPPQSSPHRTARSSTSPPVGSATTNRFHPRRAAGSRRTTLKQRMARKLRTQAGKAGYARRKAIVEPVFGQIATLQGKHVLLRGLDKITPAASGICSLLATTSANSTATSESTAWEASERPPDPGSTGQIWMTGF